MQTRVVGKFGRSLRIQDEQKRNAPLWALKIQRGESKSGASLWPLERGGDKHVDSSLLSTERNAVLTAPQVYLGDIQFWLSNYRVVRKPHVCQTNSRNLIHKSHMHSMVCLFFIVTEFGVQQNMYPQLLLVSIQSNRKMKFQ